MTEKHLDTPGLETSLKTKSKSFFSEILNLLFPNTCAGCGEIIDKNEFLCDYCYTMINQIKLEKFCTLCGNKKDSCFCKKRIFHFSGVAAPYYNQDIARLVMHCFKFRHREELSLFFARKMALTVKQFFGDIDFDFITFVPMRMLRKLNRGYNQSELLAMELSKILKLPCYKNILYSLRKNKIQHKSTLNERFDNVKKIYYTKLRLNGGNVLLVDDIKTSGATLDACARQLLMAGADKVYCVTALITAKADKNQEKGNNYGN